MSFLFLLFTTTLSAAVRPEIPTPDVDKVLTHDLSARVYFNRKSQSPACAAKLTDLKANYRSLKRELLSMKSGGASSEALDAKEKESFTVLEQLTKSLEECGECAQQEIVLKDNYTIADGSCQLPTEDKALLEATFEKSAEDMLNVQKYSALRNGFPALLEFVGLDYNTGELLPSLGKLAPTMDKFNTYVAVEGPINPLTGSLMGFDYVSENQIITRERNGLKELIILVKGVQFPDGFEAPVVYSVSAGGKKRRPTNVTLTKVQAMWYLNSDGYSRYYTGANFGFLGGLEYLKKQARKTLINTLYRQVERSLGEP